MASLSSSRIGNASPTALIRSANALQNQLATNKDEEAALAYRTSGYTDDALKSYQDYLQSRIDHLNTTGSVTNSTRALSLTGRLDDAIRSNVSASVTRENIQMMAGNASTSDKLNLVASQAARAQSIGDMTLYQSLESQAYSLSQTLQKEQVDAAVAGQTLATVNSALSQIPGYGGYSGGTTGGGGNNTNWVQQITAAAKKYGVDPNAALAVASSEGLSGAVGDSGTSFGPFQLHIGGALPAGKDRAWAESAAGIDYAVQRIAGVAKGLTGQAAVSAIVNGFERPANPEGEVARAMAVYGSPGKLTSSQVNLQTGSATPSDIAANATDYAKSVAQAESTGADTLLNNLKELNQKLQLVGTNGLNKAVDEFVKGHKAAFQAMGVDIPDGAKPNYGDILTGTYLALNKYYQFASTAAYGAGDLQQSQDYANKANDYASGTAKIPTLVKGTGGGTKSMGLADLQELSTALAQPGSNVRYMQAANGDIIEKPQAGLNYDIAKGAVPAYSANPYINVAAHPENLFQKPVDDPNAYVSAPLDLTTTLNHLGLQYKASSNGYASQGQEALVTDNTAQFVKKFLKPGTAIQVWMSPQGLQFAAAPTTGEPGNSVYTVVRDGGGKQGVYESGPEGDKLLGGEYGFNWRNPAGSPQDSQGFLQHFGSALSSLMNTSLSPMYASMFGHANVHGVVANGTAEQTRQAVIAAANKAAAAALLAKQAAPLPTITPAPTPVYSQPVYQRPYNPQPAPAPVQNPAPVYQPPSGQLQGGNTNLNNGNQTIGINNSPNTQTIRI